MQLEGIYRQDTYSGVAGRGGVGAVRPGCHFLGGGSEPRAQGKFCFSFLSVSLNATPARWGILARAGDNYR